MDEESQLSSTFKVAADEVAGRSSGVDPTDLHRLLSERHRRQRRSRVAMRMVVLAIALPGIVGLVQLLKPESRREAETSSAPVARVASCPAMDPSEEPPNGIEVSLRADKDRVSTDGVVALTVRLSNTNRSMLALRHGSQRVEYWATDDLGRVVWIWSNYLDATGTTFTGDLQYSEVPSGGILTQEANWTLESCGPTPVKLPSGRYEVFAAWLLLNDAEGRRGTKPIARWISSPIEVIIG